MNGLQLTVILNILCYKMWGYKFWLIIFTLWSQGFYCSLFMPAFYHGKMHKTAAMFVCGKLSASEKFIKNAKWKIISTSVLTHCEQREHDSFTEISSIYWQVLIINISCAKGNSMETPAKPPRNRVVKSIYWSRIHFWKMVCFACNALRGIQSACQVKSLIVNFFQNWHENCRDKNNCPDRPYTSEVQTFFLANGGQMWYLFHTIVSKVLSKNVISVELFMGRILTIFSNTYQGF